MEKSSLSHKMKCKPSGRGEGSEFRVLEPCILSEKGLGSFAFWASSLQLGNSCFLVAMSVST